MAGCQSFAQYSACEKYRYALRREWDRDLPRLTFVMLNPSKATEVQNDPTIERCERRARALGFGAVCATNLFAWRETEPRLLKQASEPIGPENDAALLASAQWADVTIAAWGVHGVHLDRAAQVRALLHGVYRPISHLGLTKHGHPRHPLYVSYATQPVLWET